MIVIILYLVTHMKMSTAKQCNELMLTLCGQETLANLAEVIGLNSRPYFLWSFSMGENMTLQKRLQTSFLTSISDKLLLCYNQSK